MGATKKLFIDIVKENNEAGLPTMIDLFGGYKTKKVRKSFGDSKLDLDWEKKQKEASEKLEKRADGKVFVTGMGWVS